MLGILEHWETLVLVLVFLVDQKAVTCLRLRLRFFFIGMGFLLCVLSDTRTRSSIVY